ncbi:MAG: rod shape-determining protein MreC [Actinomycetota bacterium]|nr:rod shape-determining protein MreC [Actinomycetota bacterium]
MAVYRRTSRPRFTLLLLILTSVTLLTLSQRGSTSGVIGAVRSGARDIFAPVQRVVTSATRPVGDFFAGAVHYGDLKKENGRLRQQLNEEQGKVLQATDAERERKALLDQQNLAYLGDIPTVSARVVDASASNFQQTIEIDQGRSSGVAKDMPVVSGAGLVGRVIEVSRTRAVVLLITDPTSAVGVRLTGSGDVGVGSGEGQRNPLSVDLIASATVVKKGETVVTSGLQQSVFPPSIPVGKVRTIKKVPSALLQDITIDPVVDLKRLTFVKVVQWSPSK